jgi:hypothetical protein
MQWCLAGISVCAGTDRKKKEKREEREMVG